MRFPVFEARKAAAFRVNEGPIMKTRGTKPPAGKKQGAAKRKRQSLAGLMPLEPRVMYDAAGAHTAASHVVLDPHHNDPSHLDPSHLADLSNHPQANASTSTDNAPQKTTSTSPVPGSITSISSVTGAGSGGLA
jgi:hypothetical protein